MTIAQLSIFEIIGTLLAIGSVLIIGFIVSKIEGTIERLDSKASDIGEQLTKSREAMARSYQLYEPAQLKLLIIQSTNPPKIILPAILSDIVQNVVKGLVERSSAATGELPSQRKFTDWEQMAQRAFLKNDVKALSDISKLSSEFIPEWVVRHNSMAANKIEINAKIGRKKRLSAWARYAAVALQVLGIIFVLVKNTPPT